jgi:hypothetical protein
VTLYVLIQVADIRLSNQAPIRFGSIDMDAAPGTQYPIGSTFEQAIWGQVVDEIARAEFVIAPKRPPSH